MRGGMVGRMRAPDDGQTLEEDKWWANKNMHKDRKPDTSPSQNGGDDISGQADEAPPA